MGDVINTNLNGALLPSEELHESKVKPEWTRITFVIITSFLGAGVLSLPYSLSQLAYVPFYTLLVFVSVGSIVASDCYGRLYQVCPKAKVLADVAREAFGRRGEQICRCAVMIYLGGIITIFQLTCTISLQEMIGGGCQAYLGLIVALLAFSALQARSMHDLSFISVIGSVAIIVPCIMLLIAIPLRGQRKHASSDIFWASSSTIVRKAVGAMDLSFAYAGQVIFIELQNGMAKPKDFMKSVYSSSAVMTLTYAIVAAVGYHFVGQHDLRDGEPISTKLAKGSPMLRAINAFVLLHILIAYAVEGNVLSRGILHALGNGDAAEAQTTAARAAWSTTTVCIVLGAYLVCSLVPFFSDIMSLVSATCGVALNFTFPILLVLKLAPPTSLLTRVTFRVLIFLSILVALAGTAASGIDIANKLVLKPPFTC